jgi:putative glutamine amidotransferase
MALFLGGPYFELSLDMSKGLKFLHLIVLVVSVLALASLAEAKIQFYKVTSKSLLIPLLIAVPEAQSPDEAWGHYIRQLQTNSDMVELFQGIMSPPVIEEFSRVTDRELAEVPVVIANDPADYSKSYEDSVRKLKFRGQLRGFVKTFGQLGRSNLLMVPIAADLGLGISDSRDLKYQIANKVKLLISQGGDDVDTSLYRLPKIWSGYTNKTRDLFEYSLIREFVKNEKGFLLGICRGMQITSVVLGYKLIQDIPQQMGTKVDHSPVHMHSLNLLRTSLGLFQGAASSQRFLFNSYHHQAVIFKAGGQLEASAITDDGTLEAAEFKNGKGFLIQGHPELTENNLGLRLIRAWPASQSSAGFCKSALG